MKVWVRVQNAIPTKHNHRVIYPEAGVEDDVQPGETPLQAARRLSLIANAIFAREVLDQLRFTDRQVQIGNEQWCDEYLSTVASDHPAVQVDFSSTDLPPGAQATLRAVGEAISEAAVQHWKKAIEERSPDKG